MSQIEHYLADGVMVTMGRVTGVMDAEYIMTLAQNAATVLMVYGRTLQVWYSRDYI
jgi:hypothetical protein